MRTCKEVAARLSLGLDEPLPLGERIALRAHMMMCRHCTRYYAQIRALRQLARGLRRFEQEQPSPRAELSPEARERIARAVDRARED